MIVTKPEEPKEVLRLPGWESDLSVKNSSTSNKVLAFLISVVLWKLENFCLAMSEFYMKLFIDTSSITGMRRLVSRSFYDKIIRPNILSIAKNYELF